jgi:hypothetical protein
VALSEDQKAMLRLLAQREEGYEDIAALLGLSVAEVRARVKGALAELDAAAAGPAEPPALPPPPEPQPSRPRRGSEGVSSTPRSEIPVRERPQQQPTLAARLGQAVGSRRRLAELGGGLLVALLLVLFATGAVDIGGGDSDRDSADDGATSELPASGARQLTQAVLRDVAGGEATGQAVFGRLKGQVLLVLAAEGLQPSPRGRSYALSLARSPSDRIPVAAFRVGDSGRVAEQFKVPVDTLGLLAAGYDQMEVSLVVNSTLRKALLQAAGERPPSFRSTDVMRGQVTGPIVAAGRAAQSR